MSDHFTYDHNYKELLEAMREGKPLASLDLSVLNLNHNKEGGKLPFLIKRDGTWLYRGEPILRKSLICLFASLLTRDEQGNFILETPYEQGTIDVEDAPFLIVSMQWTGCGRRQILSFQTNIDQVMCLGEDHPMKVDLKLPFEEGGVGSIPYVFLYKGKGEHGIWARISRAVYYELMALAEEETYEGKPSIGVWSQNIFFPFGYLESDFSS